ncbi:MAG: GNAT family N-acetyltransferase [Christensenellaceae bacterium]|nr:GNAT family N-acetyltransferase [Christensenellaceae bacterium]
MNGEAIFDYPWFELYFTDADRWAYIIREQETDKLLGFVMVKTREGYPGYMIAEFMVIPKYRRNGIGRRAATACFDRFRGEWEVSPAFGSETAYQFWKGVIDSYTDGNNRFEDRKFLFCNAK